MTCVGCYRCPCPSGNRTQLSNGWVRVEKERCFPVRPERVIAALDTNVVRRFAYPESAPAWLDRLEDAARGGVCFCLPEACFFEVLRAWRDERLSPDRFLEFRQRVGRLLYRKMPILPSNRELFRMAGILPIDESTEVSRPWRTVQQVRAKWRCLLKCATFSQFMDRANLRDKVDAVLTEIQSEFARHCDDFRAVR